MIVEAGVIVRGPPGAGKTSLVLRLVEDARRDGLFASLVADDRVSVEQRGGRLVARPHPLVAGLVERRGLGLVPVDYEPACVVRLVVDLEAPAPDAEPLPRLPEPADLATTLAGVALARLRLPAERSPDALASLILYQLAWARLIP